MKRRQFLRHTALGVAGLHLLKSAPSAWSAQANERLNIALVGVGGRGHWFTAQIPRLGENLVALCDVDDSKNPDAYTQLPRARRFRDFRRMLDEMGKSIDAVIVATPDHTHAVVAAAALRAGQHVYCEKPLTRTVHESRALCELARKYKVATSMGNQGTASGPFRRALELIQQGTIGVVKAVHIWNCGDGPDRKERPANGGPVPDFLDWDLWLGPTAYRPYHRQWMQRNLWRDFGGGELGNWGSHSANLGFMALKVHELWTNAQPDAVQARLRITAEHSGVNRLSFPKWQRLRWEIPGRADLPPIAFTWHTGSAPGSRALLEELAGEELDWGDKKERKWRDHSGAIIVGAKGRIRATEHNASFRLLPEKQFEGITRNGPLNVEASRGHEADWLLACKGGTPAWANFDYADALNEFLMLGNVVTQIESGTMLEFDAPRMKVTNHVVADALLRCEYRHGWTL